jgi:hypothetical protein
VLRRPEIAPRRLLWQPLGAIGQPIGVAAQGLRLLLQDPHRVYIHHCNLCG